MLLFIPFIVVSPAYGFSSTEAPAFSDDPKSAFKEAQDQMTTFKLALSPSVMRIFEDTDRKTLRTLNRPEKKMYSRYLLLKKELIFTEQTAALYTDLINNYSAHHSLIPPDSFEWEEIKKEAARLSFNLITAISQLQKSYKINSFPIVHNLFIDIGLKKRGACKHWAEDLLKKIESVDHPHFTSFWGEAHPGNILEHNVAVIAPRGASFDEGILIDPWRTAGKPFWISVKKDNHPWQMWSGYEPR